MAFHTSPYPSSQPMIQYGRGASTRATKFSVHTSSWESFTNLFSPENLFSPKSETPVASKLSSPWILPWALLEGAPQYRKAENVSHPTLLVIDVDNKTPPYVTFSQAQQALHRTTQDPQSPLYNHAAVLYTTWSHSPDHPHFRIFLPLNPAAPIYKDNADKLRLLGHSVASILSIPTNAIDPSSFHVARLFFLPACPPESASLYQYAIFPTDPQTATFLDPDTFLADNPAPAKLKANNVLPINPTIQLPVHNSSHTSTPSTLPANIDQKQYKKLMAVSAKCLKEQGEPQWTLQTLEDMQDAAPRMGLEDRTNYAILLNCMATYEEEIDSLSSDTEGPLPGRAFNLFISMARKAKGYESTPEQEYRAHWEDVKAGGNEYGFKGFEAIHPGVLFKKALDNGWKKSVLLVNTPKEEFEYREDYYGPRSYPYWPYKFKNTYSGGLNRSDFQRWVVSEMEGKVLLDSTSDGDWVFHKDLGIFINSKEGSSVIEGIAFSLSEDLRARGEKDKDLGFLIGSNTQVFSRITKVLSKQNRSNLVVKDDEIDTFNKVARHIIPVANGYLDLKTKKLLTLTDREKADMRFMSKVPFPYVEDAGEPEMFLNFLYDVCMEREDMVEDMRDFLASALWGEHPSLGVFKGEGSRGKSTIVSTMMMLFDGYGEVRHVGESFAGVLNSSALLRSKDGGTKEGPQPELMDVLYKRFVRVQEMPSSPQPFDDGMMKRLYGSVKSLPFRQLFSNVVLKIEPIATVVIETNHDLIFLDPDYAVERRTAVFPFEYEVPKNERIKDLHVHFIEKEAEKILWWLVNANHPMKTDQEWGPTVLNATNQMLDRSSTYRRFFKSCVEKTGDNADRLSASDLFIGYNTWAPKAGIKIKEWMDVNGFKDKIKHYTPTGNYETETVNGTEVDVFRGIRFKKSIDLHSLLPQTEVKNNVALVGEFFEENCISDYKADSFISSSEIYSLYERWAKETDNVLKMVNHNDFSKAVFTLTGIKAKLRKWKGKTQRGFTGIRRKEDGE